MNVRISLLIIFCFTFLGCTSYRPQKQACQQCVTKIKEIDEKLNDVKKWHNLTTKIPLEFTGTWGTVYDNTDKKLELTEYKNGKKSGVSVIWSRDGDLNNIQHYKCGKQDGTETVYRNGLKLMEVNYQNGIKQGVEKVWNTNGELVSEGFNKDGERYNGEFVNWFPEKDTIYFTITNFSNGKQLETSDQRIYE